MHAPQAWLNGKFIPADALRISPTDAGFVQGTTIAEQLRTFGGRLFRLDDHLARLEHSLETIGVAPGISRAELASAAHELVAHNHRLLAPGDDLGLSLFVTPGEYPSYGPPGPAEPLVVLHTYPLPFRFWAAKYHAGQVLRTTSIQQVPPACWPPSLKCRSRMHYYLADREAAVAEPGSRAVLLDQAGFVTEASTANLIVYTAAGGLLTPPRAHVLRGISLAEIADLAERLHIPLSERELRPADLAAADEVLLTSTPLCLLPVTRYDGRPIGSGAPGPVFTHLLAAWSEHVGLDIAAQAERFANR